MIDPLGTAAGPALVPTTPEEKTWGMACHLSALAGYAVPFGNIIGPLLVWLLKKDTMPFVDDQGKESLNFQITVTIAALVAGLLILVLIGIPLLVAVALTDVVMIVLASVKTSEGVAYRYPVNLRFLR
jgi:uncharacterized Tic20 family protein